MEPRGRRPSPTLRMCPEGACGTPAYRGQVSVVKWMPPPFTGVRRAKPLLRVSWCLRSLPQWRNLPGLPPLSVRSHSVPSCSSDIAIATHHSVAVLDSWLVCTWAWRVMIFPLCVSPHAQGRGTLAYSVSVCFVVRARMRLLVLVHHCAYGWHCLTLLCLLEFTQEAV